MTTDFHLPEQAEPVGPRRRPRCRCPRSSRARPTCSSPPVAPARRGQRQEGPVPRALGCRAHRRQGRLHRQQERHAHRARHELRLQQPGRRLPQRCLAFADLGAPVCFDATHSVQLPGGQVTAASGGERRFTSNDARPRGGRRRRRTRCSSKCTTTRTNALCDGPNQVRRSTALPALLDLAAGRSTDAFR